MWVSGCAAIESAAQVSRLVGVGGKSHIDDENETDVSVGSPPWQSSDIARFLNPLSRPEETTIGSATASHRSDKTSKSHIGDGGIYDTHNKVAMIVYSARNMIHDQLRVLGTKYDEKKRRSISSHPRSPVFTPNMETESHARGPLYAARAPR